MLVVSLFKLKDCQDSLKSLGADILELRLDLMSQEDLAFLLSGQFSTNLKILVTIKPQALSSSSLLTICHILQPDFIDIDHSLFFVYELDLKLRCPHSELILSMHTPYFYHLHSFYKKYARIRTKKLVIETENTLEALKIAHKAKKEGLILFASGKKVSFSRFFSTWHYVYVTSPTGLGQVSVFEISKLYHQYFKTQNFYALIGSCLDPSLSHITHNHVFKLNNFRFNYFKIPLDTDQLSLGVLLLKKLGCLGLSITTPHKRKILNILNIAHLSKHGINTCDFQNKKSCNTDLTALIDLLKEYEPTSSILLLGDGACATKFKPYLKKNFLFVNQYSRKNKVPLRPYYDVIINATSTNDLDIPSCQYLINLVRGPQENRIELQAKDYGAKIINGQRFFYHQAMDQFQFWFKSFEKISYDTFFSLVKDTL
jgi:shikimate 5-dehydrogenase/3-dehydroquinate dehydratase